MSDQQAYDLETLLRELREVIDAARTMPMSASVLVNREEALERLHELVARAAVVPARRKPTRPTRSSQRKRLEGKTRRGEVKKLRSRIRSAAVFP